VFRIRTAALSRYERSGPLRGLAVSVATSALGDEAASTGSSQPACQLSAIALNTSSQLVSPCLTPHWHVHRANSLPRPTRTFPCRTYVVHWLCHPFSLLDQRGMKKVRVKVVGRHGGATIAEVEEEATTRTARDAIHRALCVPLTLRSTLTLNKRVRR
jgi:hypothetical protein